MRKQVARNLSQNLTNLNKTKGNLASTPLANEEMRICFKCKEYGHILKDCPNNRVMTLRDILEIEDDYATGKGGFEEEEFNDNEIRRRRMLMRLIRRRSQ